ncbi:glycosyltransferase [Microlunatus soli]|uniref:Lipopolysaccharide biosynthesis protein, LPS:glycosyltransferase n=1 Tax=Microlunatus soli TaxID=630515 RepID=A0A1H1M920_9ACTN|nr:glycosyltransferase [Microlunatus soli]SDR83236.1 Lipopolysaccharide biosynthesis protein, LPS:glycosyltransferase [Microlunatus soli]
MITLRRSCMFQPVRRAVRRIVPDPIAVFLRNNLPTVTGSAQAPASQAAGTTTETPVASHRATSAERPHPTKQSKTLQIAEPLLSASPADVAAAIRRLLEEKQPSTALGVASALQGTPAALAAGIVAGVRGFDDRAWGLLKDLPVEIWSVLAPSEYVRSGLACDRDATVASLWSLTKTPPPKMPARAWHDLLGPVYAYGESELAKAIFKRLDGAVGDGSGVDGNVRWPRDWFRDWVDKPGDAPTIQQAQGVTSSFAILDYRHPDRFRASANIGDHVQSLAALSHVVRHQGLRFDGADDMVDLASRLQSRVRPEVRRTDRTGTVQLLLAQRDASNHDAFPVDTWAIGFGWYMHPQFGINYDFPFHPNLRPIFVSFHVNSRQMITPEAIEYLKKYGPVGCRDWTTVDLLLSAGVDAFFSGCMTTTVSNVFPDTDVRPADDAPTAYIDVPAEKVPAGALTAGQARDAVRLTPFAQNVDFAVGMLETYRRKYADITTSRLHVYLPSRSIGVKVNFTPENMSDPRFAGLAPIDDAAFDAIRDGINAKLEPVIGAALSGSSVDEVYGLWRELTGPAVSAAKERLAQQVEIAAPTSRLASVVPQSAPALPNGLDPNAIHVAIRATRHHVRLLRVLLSSIAEHTSRPVHARIITRSPDLFKVGELEQTAPGVRVSVVDSRAYAEDLVKPDGDEHSAAEVDKFITADLFPGVRRLITMPVGTIVTGDLAELADLELDGQLLAAPRPYGSRHTSGYAVLLGAARRLRDLIDRSAEFRRLMHQRHAFDFERFETDLLVIDAQQWQERGSLRSLLGWAENFGLTYREALHAHLGAETAVIPDRWHVIPSQAPASDIALVHWAERPWPWGEDPAPLRDIWQAAQAVTNARSQPPVA